MSHSNSFNGANNVSQIDFTSKESATEPSTPKKKRKATSAAWDYFTKKMVKYTAKYVCSVNGFDNYYSFSCSTTTLVKHLRTHGLFDGDKSQERFKPSGSFNESFVSKETIQNNFFSALCEWIVDAALPFATVENEKFRDMIAVQNNDIHIPSRVTVSRQIVKKKKEIEIGMREKISNVKSKFSITTDAWSSRIYRGYIAVTLHWIDPDWTMQNILLDFIRFATPHNAKNTSKILYNLFDSWGVTSRISGITTDNAADMISAMTKLNSLMNARNRTCRSVDDFHARCIARVVNLSVSDAFEIIKKIVNSVRSLVNAVRSSLKRSDLFQSTKKSFGTSASIPSLDLPTRWSSTFNIISTTYKSKRVFNMITEKSSDLRSFAISECK